MQSFGGLASYPHRAHCDQVPLAIQTDDQQDGPIRRDPSHDRLWFRCHTEDTVYKDRPVDYVVGWPTLPRFVGLRGEGRGDFYLRDRTDRTCESSSGASPCKKQSRGHRQSDDFDLDSSGNSHRQRESPWKACPHRELSRVAPLARGETSSLPRNQPLFLPAHNPLDRGSPWGSPSSLSSGSNSIFYDWEPVHIGSKQEISPSDVSSPASSSRVDSQRSSHDTLISNSKPSVARPETAPASSTRQSRYLREMDRRLILSRLAKGEKQAAIAKEYGVSRSTICNLSKQRDIVLARTHENPLCRHPKKARLSTSVAKRLVVAGAQDQTMKIADLCHIAAMRTTQTTPRVHEQWPTRADNVLQVQSRAIDLLQTKLQDRETSDDDFYRTSTRLMRLVLEEAIGIVAARCNPPSPHSDHSRSPPLVDVMCAVAMGESRPVLLDLFRRLEPDVTTGIIGDSLTTPSKLKLHMTSHSSHLSNRNVLLLDMVVASGDDTVSAIDLLRARGVSEDRITVVALFVAAEVVTLIQCMRPGVRIVTTGVGDLIPRDHSRP